MFLKVINIFMSYNAVPLYEYFSKNKRTVLPKLTNQIIHVEVQKASNGPLQKVYFKTKYALG